MGKIILITGGARSGKSGLAESYASKHGKKIAYIATAQVRDAEMNYRVALHRKRRPASWTTYESPFMAEKAIEEAGEEHDFILFDCVTLYLSNLLCQREGGKDLAADCKEIMTAFARVLQAAAQTKASVLFVTNEVGEGIVPENAMAREYRDLSGLVNQMIAREAAAVYMVICGLPVNIKKLAENLGE